MQKNLLKQQLEFTIGSREELDSAYERFQNILSMLELYVPKVSFDSCEFDSFYEVPTICMPQASAYHATKCASHSDEIYVLALLKKHLCLHTHDDEDLHANSMRMLWKILNSMAGHFARGADLIKYQENRANGRKEKKIVAIEDSNSKALVATDNNEEIDETMDFDDEQ
ncbi:hypothetical protein Tco_1314469 [Tanacetum coccineum]